MCESVLIRKVHLCFLAQNIYIFFYRFFVFCVERGAQAIIRLKQDISIIFPFI